MRDQWLDFCTSLAARTDGSFYAGNRKIFRGVTWKLRLGPTLELSDLGYTKHKMRQLERNYYHKESHDMAISLWTRRVEQAKYGSVGFTCYNHLLKADPTKKSKRASVMGPCIQSVVLTLIKKNIAEVDVFYRTTEVLKKFPADLVFLRDVLLKPFNLPENTDIRFHFANLTVHPMYFVTILPMRADPVADLDELRVDDPYYFKWVVKWTARYLCPEFGRGIDKFAQACRVRDTSAGLIKKPKKLIKYLRANHPGFKR